MGIREDVLALADELEGVSLKDDCESCLASGTGLCRGDLECAESVHKACAKRLRAIVEHEAEDVTTMRAYDLLPDDEREAIAWVREHGGLDMVASRFGSGEIAADMLWGKGHGRFWTTDEFEEEISKRLMPKGMEWPTVDGKPVDFVTGYGPSLGVLEAVSIYNTGACEVMGHDGIIKDVKEIHVATPKAFDADGVEICVGDRLYDTDTGCGRTVRAVNDNGTVEFDGHENRGWFGRFLTHRAPVIAADGKPLLEGETVWHVGDGVEFTVIGLPRSGEYQAVKLRLDDGAVTGLDPDQLTHQRPVLDADGEEIRVGDVLYSVETGDYVTVGSIEPGNPWFATTDGALQHCAKFTHRAPVFAADGMPLREGEHVYHVETGAELVVKELPKPGEYQAVVVFALPTSPASHLTSFDPDRLTHERPDSWERLEEDAGKNPFDYCKDVGHRLDTCENSEAYKARDLVRRARKLAERGE